MIPQKKRTESNLHLLFHEILQKHDSVAFEQSIKVQVHTQIPWEPNTTLQEPMILESKLLRLVTFPVITRVSCHSQCLILQIRSYWSVQLKSPSVSCSSSKEVYHDRQPSFHYTPQWPHCVSTLCLKIYPHHFSSCLHWMMRDTLTLSFQQILSHWLQLIIRDIDEILFSTLELLVLSGKTPRCW